MHDRMFQLQQGNNMGKEFSLCLMGQIIPMRLDLGTQLRLKQLLQKQSFLHKILLDYIPTHLAAQARLITQTFL
jgi:hypothetical protein